MRPQPGVLRSPLLRQAMSGLMSGLCSSAARSVERFSCSRRAALKRAQGRISWKRTDASDEAIRRGQSQLTVIAPASRAADSRVVRGQVDRRMLGAVGEDRLQRRDVRLGVGCDRVGAPRVSCSSVSVASPASITWRPASSTQITEMWPGVCPGVSTATMRPSSLSARLRGKAPKGPPSSAKGSGANPGGSGWRRTRRITRGKGAREEPQLGIVDPHRRAHVDEPVDVVAVVVGEHDLRDVLQRQAGRRQGARELLLARPPRSGRTERSAPPRSRRCRSAAGARRARSPSSGSAAGPSRGRAGTGQAAAAGRGWGTGTRA